MRNVDMLKPYFAIADFIAAFNGPSCEVIVHDLSDLRHSIKHIVNGNITNRTVGGSITDFALGILQNEKYKKQNHIVNYIGKTKDSEKILRSSTFFIKDNKGKNIGLLCVNIDISDLLKAKDTIDRLILVSGLDRIDQNQKGVEHFSLPIEKLIDEIIKSVILESGLKPAQSSMEQKRKLISSMETKGIFRLKGSVNTVSKLLGMSIQTIYRYLKEAKNPSQ